MPEPRLVPDWLSARAATLPEQFALVTGDERLSFAELDRRVTARAQQLRALGLSAGGRVAVLLDNGATFVEMVHAVGRAGASIVPLNTHLAPAEIAWQLTDAQAELLVFDGAHETLARSAAAGLHGVRLAQESEAGRPADPVPAREHIDLDSVHAVIYTSGTTGRPKGAMLTYDNHWWSAVGSALNLGTRANDCWLAVLPLYHVGGLSILLRSVIYGVPAIVHESFDPERVNRAIDEEGVTIVSVVSVMLRRMLEQRGAEPYPRRLRCVLLGGGPAPQPLLEDCAARGIPVVQTYGLTETDSQAVTLAPADALRKLGSAGKPLLPNELRILREGASDPVHEDGEILIRGPSITKGYVNSPEATAAAIRDGWLHTGDVGYLDAEGYLFVLDRRDDLIVSGGENVYPAEVEAALVAHPAVEEAGVIGVPDERWGQVPVAAVVLRAGARVDSVALLAFCEQRLARYKLPKQIWQVQALPRNASGKLQRNLLRQALGADPPNGLPGLPL